LAAYALRDALPPLGTITASPIPPYLAAMNWITTIATVLNFGLLAVAVVCFFAYIVFQ
jgi:hypothetical protein